MVLLMYGNPVILIPPYILPIRRPGAIRYYRVPATSSCPVSQETWPRILPSLVNMRLHVGRFDRKMAGDSTGTDNEDGASVFPFRKVLRQRKWYHLVSVVSGAQTT